MDMDNVLPWSSNTLHSPSHTEEESHKIRDTHQKLLVMSPDTFYRKSPEIESNAPKQYVYTAQNNSQVCMPSFKGAINSDQRNEWRRTIKMNYNPSTGLIHGILLQCQNAKPLFRASW